MSCVPSHMLILALPAYLGTTRSAAVQGFGDGTPSTADQILAVADGASARVANAWDAVTSWPGRAAGDAASWARGQLISAANDFQTAAIHAASMGLDQGSRVLALLAERASEAAAQVGENMHDAFRNFWGFDPGAVPEFVGVGVVLLAAAAFALAFSPGGQGGILALSRAAPQLAASLARLGLVL